LLAVLVASPLVAEPPLPAVPPLLVAAPPLPPVDEPAAAVAVEVPELVAPVAVVAPDVTAPPLAPVVLLEVPLVAVEAPA
jgi:hypothetical protein